MKNLKKVVKTLIIANAAELEAKTKTEAAIGKKTEASAVAATERKTA